jgi:DNA-binding response OmpR family regulator
LGVFLNKQVDLIFTDWQMQPLTGIELTKRIRTSPDSTNVFVPIIMITAFREREHVFKVRDAGVTEYVVKSVSPKSLFSQIEAKVVRPRWRILWP